MISNNNKESNSGKSKNKISHKNIIKEKNTTKSLLTSNTTSSKYKAKSNHKLIPDYIIVNSLPEGRIKSYSYYSNTGKTLHGLQKINMDSYLILPKFNNSKDFNIFCIMDGHGPDGHFVSYFIKKYFLSFFKTNKILNSKESKNNLEYIYYYLQKDNYSLIKETYHKAEKELFKNKNIDSNFSGTSCIILIQIGDKIICANVGNSRAIMIKNYDRIIPISIDSAPQLPEESERILKYEGEIVQMEENEFEIGPFRIWKKGEKYPGLNISRSIGDFVATSLGVISTPNVIEKYIDKETQFIVIASSGILKVMSNTDILDIVMLFYPNGNCKEASRMIVNEAGKFWLSQEEYIVDDLTGIVIFF